jgi:hypothetical protein
MPIINVTINSARTLRAVIVVCDPDVFTFCPVTIALTSTIIGNPAGIPLRWEQVLNYTYTSINRTTRQFTVSGNITGSFYSARELIQIFTSGTVFASFSVASAIFNGTNTIITVNEPISLLVPPVGVLQHAGSATDSSFTFAASQNQEDTVITPTAFSDKTFRLWASRGQPTQSYDDINVILTPRDIQRLGESRFDAGYGAMYPCRAPIVTVRSDTPYPPLTGSSGSTVVTNQVYVSWTAGTCDATLVSLYIVQRSCNGGDTWDVVYTSTGPGVIQVTEGCNYRVGAVYPVTGLPVGNTTAPVESIDSLFVVWSAPAYALPIPNGYLVQSAYDTHYMPSSTRVAFDPITLLQVSQPVILTVDENYIGVGISALTAADPITVYAVSGVIVMDTQTDTYDALGLTSAGYNPITSYAVSGSVTVGG